MDSKTAPNNNLVKKSPRRKKSQIPEITDLQYTEKNYI
jgi:hypothetical protein